MSREVNCKVKIRYGKLFTQQSRGWYELERQKSLKTIPIKKPIDEYKKVPYNANIYFVIEDRVFFSHSINDLHKITPKETRQALVEHILQGIQVTENRIQEITLKYPNAEYVIGDFMEIVAAFEAEEETNEERLFNNEKNI